MADFQFYGRDEYGTEVRGKRNSPTAEVLATQLLEERITPISIEMIETKNHFLNKLRMTFYRTIPIDELRMFARQMYTLNKAGIPLLVAVTRLAETTKNVRFSEALRDVAEDLNAGKTLSVSMEKHTKIFSPLFVNVIRVGESSARLDESFQQISKYLGLEEATIKRVKTTVRYPTFVMLALLASLLVVNTLVIPAFDKMFSNMDASLPVPTQILIATSNFIMSYWPILLIAVCTGIIALRMYFLTPLGKYTWHRIQLRVPLIGWIIKRVLLTRFCRTLAMVMRSGISILEGVNLVAAAMGNAYMEKKINDMHDAIARGESLSQSAANAQLFSPLIVQMLTLGEETGKIEEMLSEVADFYEREVDYDLDRLSDMMEPFLLLFMAGMVTVLAMGIFLPMWDMISFV